MSVSAHDVAVAIRRRLPGVGDKKLHKLLYFAQGFHLAHLGEPLFTEAIEAWDIGPVVTSVWRDEKRDNPPGTLGCFDNGQLNTLGYVVSRYGDNSDRELETLIHHEGPWRAAHRRRFGGRGRHVIGTDALREYFHKVVEADYADDEVWLDPADIARLLAGSRDREKLPSSPDSSHSLWTRMVRG